MRSGPLVKIGNFPPRTSGLTHHWSTYLSVHEEIPDMNITHLVGKLERRVRWSRKGFTLVEIMIVVLIIGILLAIAVPNFIKARDTSRAKACTANLKQIESAKEQWAMDNKAATNASPGTTDLYGTTAYIRSTPSCPS